MGFPPSWYLGPASCLAWNNSIPRRTQHQPTFFRSRAPDNHYFCSFPAPCNPFLVRGITQISIYKKTHKNFTSLSSFLQLLQKLTLFGQGHHKIGVKETDIFVKKLSFGLLRFTFLPFFLVRYSKNEIKTCGY